MAGGRSDDGTLILSIAMISVFTVALLGLFAIIPVSAHFGFPSQQQAENLLHGNVARSGTITVANKYISGIYLSKEEIVFYNS